jgi:DNA polymerase-3 subunit gamma/tau
MRDALSILDQVVSFSQGNVTYKTVIDNLNVLDYDYYFRLTEAIIENKVSRNLLLLNEIMSKGFYGQQILSGLAIFFRDLLVCTDPETIVLFEVGDAVKKKYLELATRCSTPILYKAMELTNETDLNYRLSKNKRLSIELLLIRLCQLNSPQQEDDKKKILIEPLTDNAVPQTTNTVPLQKETEETPVNKTPIAEPGKGTEKRPVSTVPRFGINIDRKEEEKKPVKEEEILIYNERFTQEALLVAWKQYANAADDIHLKNTMLYLTPELTNNNKVGITVLNPEQAHKFQEKEKEIKEFLFTQLKNNQIELDVKINEDDSKSMPFTNKEKYEYMVEKNSDLNRLVQEFNLRLD